MKAWNETYESKTIVGFDHGLTHVPYGKHRNHERNAGHKTLKESFGGEDSVNCPAHRHTR